METLLIFKIGGKILEDASQLHSFLAAFARLPQKKILIHGGGVFAEQLAKKLDIATVMHEGRRITCAATRDLVTMVYGGLLNKKLVSQLQSLTCDSIGLCGADAHLLKAERRPPEPIDYGFVGDITAVRWSLLESLLQEGLTPVIAPLSLDKDGEILNSNADGVAYKIAGAALGHYQVNLFYCFDRPGVLLDSQDPASVIARLNFREYQTLQEQGIVSSGMLPKLDYAFRAKREGVERVLLVDPSNGIEAAQDKPYYGTSLYTQ